MSNPSEPMPSNLPSSPNGGNMNMSVEINGGQNLVGQNTIAGGVNQFVGEQKPTVSQVYDVIRKAIPQHDTDALAAANYLESQETEVGGKPEDAGQEPPEGVRQSQSYLGRYREPIMGALKEMGLMWLRSAMPQVVFVEPLIRMALDALQKQNS